MLQIRRWLRRHKKLSRGGTAIMVIAGIWGLFNGEPIIPYIIRSFTQPDQDIIQYIPRLIGVIFIIGGTILFYYIYKLPSDIKAKEIAEAAVYIKNKLIELNQLYYSFVSMAITYSTKDYLPLISNDLLFQRDYKFHRDKKFAARNYVANNPQNPILEKQKNESNNWKTLNSDIKKAVIDISDRKLQTYWHSYINNLEADGVYKLKAKILLSENPVANYTHRHIDDIKQKFDTSAEDSLLNITDYLNELIDEYSEEPRKMIQGVTEK